MNKRGMSPLIATVLLIGLAVALAVFVIFWGTGIIRQEIDKTAGFAAGKIDCQTKVEIDVTKARCSAGIVIVSIQNIREEKLPDFRGRVVGDKGASSSLAGVALDSYASKDIGFVYDSVNVGKPKAIEVIPVVYEGNDLVTCDASKIAIETEDC